tara:strand:+ start:606 stop:914 length:309 start_codon:yes stop_codon:yes gene_type:complete
MNTVKKFLEATGFKRGINQPSAYTLKVSMNELNVTESTEIDVMTFFLYDEESIHEEARNLMEVINKKNGLNLICSLDEYVVEAKGLITDSEIKDINNLINIF